METTISYSRTRFTSLEQLHDLDISLRIVCFIEKHMLLCIRSVWEWKSN